MRARFLAFALLTVASCAPAPGRFAARDAARREHQVAYDRETEWDDVVNEAHVTKNAGLDTPAKRLRYFQLLDDACERGHVSTACIEAAAAAPGSASSLLFHGCSLGDASACQALVRIVSTEKKISAQEARAEADRALALGCASNYDAACDIRGDLDNQLSHASVVVLGDTDASMEEAQNARRMLLALRVCRQGCAEMDGACRQNCTAAAVKTCQEQAPHFCDEIK